MYTVKHTCKICNKRFDCVYMYGEQNKEYCWFCRIVNRIKRYFSNNLQYIALNKTHVE